jgi:1,4-dihydroxy-2-naphthoate octaprenyltransferase
MEPAKPKLTTELARISHPEVLLASILLYALGGGMADYLGHSIRWDIYLAGQGAVLFLLLSSYFLREYYSLPMVPLSQRGLGAPVISRNQLLAVSATTLTVGAVLTVMLVASGALNATGFVFLGLAFALVMIYALPPFRLAYSGYGELVIAIVMANLVPAIALILQTGEFHRLVVLLTFPLTFLYLSSFLAVHLERYARDVREGRRTMLTRLGWQRGMNLHNLLILLGFFTLGCAALVGLPWRLTWPGLLGLVVGAFQIVQMIAIGNGAKPRWALLRITAAATFALTVYFMTYALWIG